MCVEAQRIQKTDISPGAKRWREHHEEFRKKHELKSVESFTATHLRMHPELTKNERVADLIDIAWEHAKKKSQLQESELMARLFLDTSQSVQRLPWTWSTLRTLTTSSKVFSFAELRYMEPVEMLRCLGFTKEVCERASETLSSGQLADIGAEAMAAPTVALCLLGLCAALPVWKGT